LFAPWRLGFRRSRKLRLKWRNVSLPASHCAVVIIYFPVRERRARSFLQGFYILAGVYQLPDHFNQAGRTNTSLVLALRLVRNDREA
jgi:hypothetical protein